MADESVEYGRIRQTTEIDRTGAQADVVIVPIYINKHGPFTERFTPAEWADGYQVSQRIEQLRARLRALPR